MRALKQKLKLLELCYSGKPINEKSPNLEVTISYLKQLKKEVENLVSWKTQASEVLKGIDLQAIGKELGVGLGESISENLLDKVKLHTEKNRIEGILLGLKICREMWAQGTISHENIYENEVMYKEELKNLIENPTIVI